MAVKIMDGEADKTVVTITYLFVASFVVIVKEGENDGEYTATKFPFAIVRLLENVNVRAPPKYVEPDSV